ncbi:unnamed protein product [Trifolium pratense]|uniref:Uncharacterized protein n=1 Tax=Trifolium pratense TaxID=57577 RepID=A0ACB0KEG0_TRIPR|nr:unnamed protein product [Trifolium pratense]
MPHQFHLSLISFICASSFINYRLERSDLQVVTVVIGVFYEFSSKEPRPYLQLAPKFHRVLVKSKNNWVLILILIFIMIHEILIFINKKLRMLALSDLKLQSFFFVAGLCISSQLHRIFLVLL